MKMKSIMSSTLKTLLLLALMLLALNAAALAEGTVTTTGAVNLREGPGLDYESIDTIDEGERLSYDRTSEDDRGVVWYRVKYDGQRGWISSKYTTKKGKDSAKGKVTTTNDVRLRSGPGTDYASRLVIEAGTVLSYDKIAEDDDGDMWYHVSYDGKSGWISARYARRGEVDIGGAVTTTGDVNLRTGPSLDYSSRGVIPEGEVLSYDRTEQDERGVTWYRVKYDGQRGWISSRYTREGGSDRKNRIRTTGSVHLRAGAGLDYESLDVIDEGVTLTYDRTKEDERGVIWYRVTYDGTRGWVSERYAEER